MKRFALSALAIISLALVPVLALGYFYRMQFQFGYNTRQGPCCVVGVLLVGGRVMPDLYWFAGKSSNPGFVFSVEFPAYIPAGSRTLWEFYAEAKPDPFGGTQLRADFPSWLILPLCVLPPLVWLRRRTGTVQVHGFSIRPLKAE